jgi:hypothetical protein
MYSGREGTPSLMPPRHLEKTITKTRTMHCLLVLSLAINENQLNLVGNLVAKRRHVIQWSKSSSLIF